MSTNSNAVSEIAAKADEVKSEVFKVEQKAAKTIEEKFDALVAFLADHGIHFKG